MFKLAFINNGSRRILLNWTILRVEDEAHIVGDFFMKTVKTRLSYECGNTPPSVCAGPNKNSLDHVSDDNLLIVLLTIPRLPLIRNPRRPEAGVVSHVLSLVVFLSILSALQERHAIHIQCYHWVFV